MFNFTIINLLYLFILLTRGRRPLLTFSIEQLLPRPTFGDTCITMSSCVLICFFQLYAVVKQTLKLVFHTKQSMCLEISAKCLSLGHNNVMTRTDIKLATLRSLARCYVIACLDINQDYGFKDKM